MSTRTPIVLHEWYHCYNRGVDKRRVFTSQADYQRFLALLYICNGKKNVRLAERYNPSLLAVLNDKSLVRGEPLVEIGAYALMPNHLHIVCREINEGGIANFMQKVFTGYTMYFNKKNDRAGSLFAGTFKSRHIDDDRYLKQVMAYVLLNPAELFAPAWKEGIAVVPRLQRQLMGYRYSSLPDFFGIERLEGKIVSDMSEYYDKRPLLKEILSDAQEYYQEQHPKV